MKALKILTLFTIMFIGQTVFGQEKKQTEELNKKPNNSEMRVNTSGQKVEFKQTKQQVNAAKRKSVGSEKEDPRKAEKAAQPVYLKNE